MDFLLNNLNEAQKKAVLHGEGPLLVLAGAGTGKTRAISHRVAYLVSKGVEPHRILAITFTNKAAGEMKERIGSLLEELRESGSVSLGSFSTPFVSTFHSLGVYVLRRHGEAAGAPKNFSILDKGDSLSVFRSAMKELEIDPKQFQPQKISSMISRMKGDLVTQETYEAEQGSAYFPGVVSKIWKKYEELLKAQGALDFDDLVSKFVFLLKNDKKVREYYQNLWQHILIDEYQDTNKSQYELSKILAEKHHNICAIGDMDQSIYGFRGADFKNITNFERDFPERVAVVLEENYRSTAKILEAANRIIEKNKMRKERNLRALKKAGEEISLFAANDEEDEARFVVDKMKELMKKKIKPSDIAVLFRTNFQSRAFEEACIKNNVPYQMLGTRFYERKEIKDILSYVRLALNPNDVTSLERVVNTPARGIGEVTLKKFLEGKKPATLFENDEVNPKIAVFLSLMDSIRAEIKKSSPSETIKFIMRVSGYEEMLTKEGAEGKERLENLQELVTIARRYDNLDNLEAKLPSESLGSLASKLGAGLEKLLEDATLMSDQDNLDAKKEAVRLMTVHSAKGLEFDYVFVVGMEEGLFPHIMSRMASREDTEEERRLFYVAVTRAKEKLFLTFSATRMIFGSRQVNDPSSFLADIPEELCKWEEQEDSWRGGKERVIEYL